MSKTKTDPADVPVDQPLDPEMISFRAQFDERSPLDEIVEEEPHGGWYLSCYREVVVYERVDITL